MSLALHPVWIFPTELLIYPCLWRVGTTQSHGVFMTPSFHMDSDWNHLQGTLHSGITDDRQICIVFVDWQQVPLIWLFCEALGCELSHNNHYHVFWFASFDMMATIGRWEIQFLLFQRLIAIINKILECFTLPNTMDTVLEWTLVSSLFVSDNSFLITSTIYWIIFCGIFIGITGITHWWFHATQEEQMHDCLPS